MQLRTKVLLSMALAVVVSVLVICGISLWLNGKNSTQVWTNTQGAFDQNSKQASDALLDSQVGELKQVALDAWTLCHAQDQLMQRKLSDALNVAIHEMELAGGLSQDAAQEIQWNAKDQKTQAIRGVSLPAMRLGSTAIKSVTAADAPCAVVDEVKKLTGSACTVFQRMNNAGDMLRVSTNVIASSGQRAVGTYIAAAGSDGAPNAVVASLLAGKRYDGRAFVVNQWYVCSYEPIKDAGGQVIGALFVGVPESAAIELRQALMGLTVDKSGYAFVLTGTGENHGTYIISKGGKRDGESLWESRDAAGSPFIQKMCEQAITLKDHEIGKFEYTWKNPGDELARNKVATLAYYKPWDWVIGISAYTDEMLEPIKALDAKSQASLVEMQKINDAARTSMMQWMAVGGVAVVIVALISAWMIARGISRPIERVVAGLSEGAEQINAGAAQVSNAAQQLAQNSATQAASLQEASSSLEIMATASQKNAEDAMRANTLAGSARQSADAGDQTINQLNVAMVGINESAGQIQKIIKVIQEIAFQTNLLALNAAVEAARAGEQGKGFAVVADEVRSLAIRAGNAASETTNLIESSVSRARDGSAVAQEAAAALKGISHSVGEVAGLLDAITLASQEQSKGVSQIAQAVANMDKTTQDNAAGAEESASAAEELSSMSEALREQWLVELMDVVGGDGKSTRAA